MSSQRNDTFANVDSASDPSAFVRCMHAQYQSNPRLVENKQATLQLMDLQAGHVVLDVGCGTGLDATFMAESVMPTGHIYGVDFSQEMVDEATQLVAERTLPLHFTQGTVYDLNFDDNFFDRCRADKTFQHLADPEAALQELIRVTKPGGKIVIGDPDHDSLIIDHPQHEITRRFVQFRSSMMAQGGIGHQLYGLFKTHGLLDVVATPLTNVYTNYDEKKASSPYLREIWVAQEHGIIDAQEAALWERTLQELIDQERFFCLQTYMVTVGTKPVSK